VVGEDGISLRRLAGQILFSTLRRARFSRATSRCASTTTSCASA
jgi:hypothetical protein